MAFYSFMFPAVVGIGKQKSEVKQVNTTLPLLIFHDLSRLRFMGRFSFCPIAAIS